MLKKLWEWLRHPHGWQLVLFYLVTALSVAGAVVFAAVGQDTDYAYLAYVFYALAAVTFGYTVYIVVRFVPKIKRNVKAFLRKFRFTRRLTEEFGFRTVIFSIASFTISIGYVAVNGVISVLERSIWYGALAAYYLVLALMRGAVLTFHRRESRRTDTELFEKRRREISVYRWCGIGLIFLPVCLSFAILQMVIGKNSFEHAGMMIYAAAAYTVYKITMSIVNIVKARREDDVTVRAIRNINFADALVSILALQTAMFKEFASGESVGLANALTGGVVCALTAALGVFVIVNAGIKQKKLQEEIYERTER